VPENIQNVYWPFDVGQLPHDGLPQDFLGIRKVNGDRNYLHPNCLQVLRNKESWLTSLQTNKCIVDNSISVSSSNNMGFLSSGF
jgi:hypothetical protein